MPELNSGALELMDYVEIGGKVPRGFTVVGAAAGAEGGAAGWLVVGAQESSFLKCFGTVADCLIGFRCLFLLICLDCA